MTLLRLEGFEGAGTTTGSGSGADMRKYIKSRYNVENNTFREGTNDSVRVASGLGFGKAMSWGGDSNSDLNFIWIPLDKTYTEIIVGFALHIPETIKSAVTLLKFYTASVEEPQVDLRIVQSRHLVCYSDTFNRITESVVMNLFSPGRWHYVEMRVVISATTGQIEVKLNGQQVLNKTNLDTLGNSGATDIDTIIIQGGEGVSTTDENEQYLIDDLYIVNKSGTVNNDFLGPVKVEELFPTAEGATINFTPQSGTDNALMVDDNPHDDDTTYNSSSDTASNKDLFTTANLSDITGNIKGVQVTNQCRSTAGMSVGMQCIVAEGTPTQGTGSVVEVSSDTKFVAVQHIFEQNPDTSAAWTAAEVDGMEIGYEID